MTVDPNLINTQTTIGQITLLILVSTTLLINLRPVLKNSGKKFKQRNISSMAQQLKAANSEISYSRELTKNLSEWQLTARELIRHLRNRLVEAGVESDDRSFKLLDLLEEIEQRPLNMSLEEDSDE